MSLLHRAYLEASELDALLDDPKLSGDVLHRFTKVLRLVHGDRVELFDGEGRRLQGCLQLKGNASLAGPVLFEDVRTTPNLVVVQSLISLDKLEWMIQKATEIGMTRLVLFEAERSVIKVKGNFDSKLERLNRIAQDAARQCGRSFVPTIEGPYKLKQIQALLDKSAQSHAKLAIFTGSPVGEKTLHAGLASLCATFQEAVFIVGPEGGLTAIEASAFEKQGALAVKWSPYILRSETAALVALSLAVNTVF